MSEIIKYCPRYIIPLAGSYDVVFTAEPWKDSPLGEQAAVKYILGELAKPLAVAYLALNSADVVGFAWGYQTIGFPASKYSPEGLTVIKSEIPLSAFFYISEVGIVPEFQGNGIGTRLVEKLVENQTRLLMRTLNTSPMLAIALNKINMTPVVAPWLNTRDPENPNRVILTK